MGETSIHTCLRQYWRQYSTTSSSSCSRNLSNFSTKLSSALTFFLAFIGCSDSYPNRVHVDSDLSRVYPLEKDAPNSNYTINFNTVSVCLKTSVLRLYHSGKPAQRSAYHYLFVNCHPWYLVQFKIPTRRKRGRHHQHQRDMSQQL